MSYSPYDNLDAAAVAAGCYPHMLLTAGLHDPRVDYWQPAKYVARLRHIYSHGSAHPSEHCGVQPVAADVAATTLGSGPGTGHHTSAAAAAAAPACAPGSSHASGTCSKTSAADTGSAGTAGTANYCVKDCVTATIATSTATATATAGTAVAVTSAATAIRAIDSSSVMMTRSDQQAKMLLLLTDMESGHFSTSGASGRLWDRARKLAFVMRVIGLKHHNA